MSAKLSMTKLVSTVFHFSSDNNLLQKCPCCLFLTRVDSLYIKYFLQSEKNAEETGNAQKCTYAEVTRTARNPTRKKQQCRQQTQTKPTWKTTLNKSNKLI